MRKFFYKLHLYLSLPVGLVIVFICLTGAIYAFQKEGNELLYPERYFVEAPTSSPLPLTQLVPMVNKQLTNNEVVSVEIPSEPNRTYTMSLKEGKKAFAFVNPYTGKIVGKTQRGEGFFNQIMALHRWLGGSREGIGKHIVGVSTIFFSLILLSGIVIWWPKTRKMLQSRLTIKIKNGTKRFMMDIHISAGIYLVSGLLLLSLTGLYFAYDWYRDGLMSVLMIEDGAKGKEKKEEKKAEKGKSTDEPVQPTELYWDKVIAEVKAKRPDYTKLEVKAGSIAVSKQRIGNARATDNYKFDNLTGELKKVEYYEDQPASIRLRGWIYTLHTGSWAGIYSKILMALISLGGATLPISGYYLFYQKRKKKFQRAKAS